MSIGYIKRKQCFSGLLLLIALQISVWGVLGLGFIGLKPIFLRAPLILIYLMLIPGILVLKLLKINKTDKTTFLLYAIGLSLVFLMIVGTIANFMLPKFGCNKPISTLPIITLISLIYLLLVYLNFKKNNLKFSKPSLKDIFSNYALFFYALPVFSALGSSLINIYESNIFLIAVLVMISLVPFFMLIYPPKNEYMYPLGLFSIALSLLYHYSLISRYIAGADVFAEYYFMNLVIKNSYWMGTIPETVNGMLSITILGPIFSKLTGLGLTTVIKVVYPFIFAFVPVGIYTLLRKFFNSKEAFLSGFFFSSFFIFFTEMTALLRQQIAEFFVILFLLSVLSKNMNVKVKGLAIIFAFSIVVSHYGTTFLFLSILFVCSAVWYFLKKFVYKNEVHSNFFPALFLIFGGIGLIWYSWVSSSKIIYVFYSVINYIFEPASRSSSQLLQMGTMRGLKDMDVYCYAKVFIQYISQGLILVGFLKFVRDVKYKKYPLLYSSVVISAMIVLGMATVIPVFDNLLNITRVYHFLLIILSPLLVIGAITLVKSINIIAKKITCPKKYGRSISKNHVLKLLSLFLCVYLLFQTAVVSELVGAKPGSLSIGWERLEKNEDKLMRLALHDKYKMSQEVTAAKWLGFHKSDRDNVLSSADYKVLISYGMFYYRHLKYVEKNTEKLSENQLLFLQYPSTQEDVIGIRSFSSPNVYINITTIPIFTQDKNKIYDNNISYIFKGTDSRGW